MPAVRSRLLLPLAALCLAGAPAWSAELATPPASVDGLWCGIGLLHEFRLQVRQQYERFEARLSRKNRVREITGHIEGSMVRTDPQRDVTLELQAIGDELRITDGSGQFALARGQGFARASGNSCS